jgi:AraC-like DNA-binding protein
MVGEDLAPYVNCIMIGENSQANSHTNIPLYADGYPGIMFQQAKNGFYLLPQKKRLSDLFLYGQTLKPVSLDVFGAHKYVVVQLYPFASKYLLNIDPKSLNDGCYDLLQADHVDARHYRGQLINAKEVEAQVEIISDLMRQLVKINKVPKNDQVQEAISIILEKNGQIKISEVMDWVCMTERTLERKFESYIGLSPKQFARIIQFQSSINRLTQLSYNSLLDIGLDSGFADQSHFIRTFKSYTGQTPSYYFNQLTNS